MSEVHEHVNSLIAAYAIGAVPEEEIPAIRAHILSCEECFAEVESLATSAAALAEAVDPVELPAGFEDRVMQQVSDPARDRVRARTKRPTLPSWARLRVPVFAGAAAVMAALLVITGLSFSRSLDRQRQYQQVVAALVQDRDAFSMDGAGGADAVVASTPEGSVLVAVDLGEAPSNRDYQLWLMKEGVPTPADTFDVSDSVVVVESRQDLTGFDGAAVTVEPEGGSKAPTTEPVLSSS